MSTVAGAAILGMTIAIPSYGVHGNVAKAEEPAVQELSDEEKGQALEQQGTG